MAFDPGFTTDPKNNDEFRRIIEATFDQVVATLTDFPVETREEALHSYANSGGEFVRYRGASKDYDCRDYFLALGRTFIPRVKHQIKNRRLTPKFAKDWGVIMMCHGFTAAHILDDSDALSNARGGHKDNRNTQRKWISHQLLPLIDQGIGRPLAEQTVVEMVNRILAGTQFPPGFNQKWFKVIVTRGELASTYDQKHLSVRTMRKLIAAPTDDIPPVDFPWNSSG
jgi:hypothetical protein